MRLKQLTLTVLLDQESCLIAAQLLMFHLVTFCQRPLRAIWHFRVLVSINIKYKYCTICSATRTFTFYWCIIHHSEQKKACQLKFGQLWQKSLKWISIQLLGSFCTLKAHTLADCTFRRRSVGLRWCGSIFSCGNCQSKINNEIVFFDDSVVLIDNLLEPPLVIMTAEASCATQYWHIVTL